MKHRARFLISLVLLASLTVVESKAQGSRRNALRDSTQLIVVTTANWDGVKGAMWRFERPKPGKKWVVVGGPIEVVVGKKGLGWGSGIASTDLMEIREDTDPAKKEGDSKAPAGVFSLSESFGYAPQAIPGTKLPYVPLKSSVECVDDTSSKYYNRVLDRGSVAPDWNSSEHMLRNDDLYRWGVVVGHNSNPPKAGAGSCIFLHIWRGSGQGTVGCTAMPQEQIESLLGWLDPAHKPLLVQMPEEQYRLFEKKQKLPKREFIIVQ